MSHGTLYYWLDGGPLSEPTTDKSAVGDGNRMLPPIPRRRTIVGKRRKPLRTSHASLVARLYRTCEREVLDIEARLARPGASTSERERNVRMLASIVQSVRGLSALAPEEAGAARKNDEADDPAPDNIDEFRLELARRIRSFVEARKAQQAAEAGEAAAQEQAREAGEKEEETQE